MSYQRACVVIALIVSFGLLSAPVAEATRAQGSISSPCTKRLISAHQGYRVNADADTIESQQAAFDIGANLADSDLWVTKDGYIVQIHDDDVSLWTNGTGLVTDMTLAQVKTLRTRPHNERIPRLNSSLALPVAHEAGRYLMFEAKTSFDDPANRQRLDDTITQAGMIDHVILYTSDVQRAHALKLLDPALHVWLKGDAAHVPPLSWVAGLNGVMLPANFTTAAVVTQFHTAGFAVIRERVLSETVANWTRFVASGADGLMSDYPKAVIARCRLL
jgi:glycerophosphoryl diester phosphodiesterase